VDFGHCFDMYGNLFIADYGNYRIRKIDNSGIIHTVAGNGTLGYSEDGGLATNAQIHFPEGVATDECGNLYIADEANSRIRKVSFNPGCNHYTIIDTLIFNDKKLNTLNYSTYPTQQIPH
jgi:hypothetical protein